MGGCGSVDVGLVHWGSPRAQKVKSRSVRACQAGRSIRKFAGQRAGSDSSWIEQLLVSCGAMGQICVLPGSLSFHEPQMKK